MISQNLAYQAVISGYVTQVVKASAMLDSLLQCGDGAAANECWENSAASHYW